MIRDIHRLTMVHIIYTMVRGWITYAVPFPVLHFEFESTRLVSFHCVLLLLFDWKRMSFSTLRQPKEFRYSVEVIYNPRSIH